LNKIAKVEQEKETRQRRRQIKATLNALDKPDCPNCGSSDTRWWGTYAEKQLKRCRCNDCQKTWTTDIPAPPKKTDAQKV
jgi:transposase-like protein